jgi:hypothetical protein
MLNIWYLMIIVKFHNLFCLHYVILNPARLEEKTSVYRNES